MSQFLLIVAGVFAVALGLVHLVIPRMLDFPAAIGVDAGGARPLARRRVGPWTYQVRREDVLGISWVMSNAASYVLLSIGAIDVAWAAGWRGLPVIGAALWVAGWWGIRASGQLVVGHRTLDLAFAAWFALLAFLHVVLGLGVVAW